MTLEPRSTTIPTKATTSLRMHHEELMSAAQNPYSYYDRNIRIQTKPRLESHDLDPMKTYPPAEHTSESMFSRNPQ